jgi:hypothetical protein
MMRTPSTYVLILLTAAAADDIHPIPLVLHPAPAPSPALKYALLPEVRDTIPGNAVTHYRQAIKNMKRDAPPQRDWYPAMEQWLAVPLKDFLREKVGKFLKPCEATFEEVELGARSEDCNWGLTEELRKKGVAVLLPDVQEMRSIATLLQLRIRSEIAEGRLDRAARSLRTGFALSRHVADTPTLVSSLVGVAVASLMEGRLEEFIQQPDAPNMYWPLTDLPRPFLDLRKPMQGERVMVYGTFPGMTEMAADLNAKPFAPEQVEPLVKVLAGFDPQNLPLDVVAKAALALRLAARHEAAKKILIDQGRPQELVDAMPHFQVGLMVALMQYDELYDDVLKWEGLPFWQARAGMEKGEARQKEILDGKDGPAIPLAKALLPAVKKVFAAGTRLDRRLAALRCVEAVRLYTADHDGKLPASLEDVKDAPMPFDPVTGKPFDYHAAGDRAFLACPPFPDQPANNANTPTFELSVKR